MLKDPDGYSHIVDGIIFDRKKKKAREDSLSSGILGLL
jgi:hypothetical protein